MITNSDMTLYHRIKGNDGDTFERHYIESVWWHNSIVSTLSTDGLKKGTNITNVVNIRIPDISYEVATEDIVVKGNHPEIDTVKDMNGVEHHIVIAANRNSHGHNQHWRVRAV